MKKILKKNKSFKLSSVKKDYVAILEKIAAISFVVAIYFTGLNHIGLTSSYYNDEETSQNILQAGVVDIELVDEEFETVESSLNFGAGETLKKQIKILGGPQSSSFIYNATTTNITGDSAFCHDITFNIDLNESSWQTGVLDNFSSATTTLYATSTGDIWDIYFNLPVASSTPNSVCSFDFMYKAVQNSNPIEEWGFVDSETASLSLYSWGLRINKVYYDVANDRGTESANEWLEIYNQTDTEIDITGWQICDNTACDTVSQSDPIPAKGFAVITPNESTWNYWQRAENVIAIILGNPIGGGLANTADMLVLKRPDGAIVDQMNWGAPDDSWVNFNEYIWNPGAVDVPEGATLGRKPSGYDTNQASDFVKLSPPLLSSIYPNQSNTLTWYWTYNYDIEWEAENPNGDNEDLSINLSYVQDTNGDESLSSIDSEFIIGKNISNTGLFNWEVPSGFVGYIWLKIAAFSPENPMLNTTVFSGKIYNSAPAQVLITEPEEFEEEVLSALAPISFEDENLSKEDTVEDQISKTGLDEVVGEVNKEVVEAEEVDLMEEQIVEEKAEEKLVVEVVENDENVVEDTNKNEPEILTEEAILPEPVKDNGEVQEQKYEYNY